MICPRCGDHDVASGAQCPGCGAVAVELEALDSLLSLEAEPVEDHDLEDDSAQFEPLAVGSDAGRPDETSTEPTLPPQESSLADDDDFEPIAIFQVEVEVDDEADGSTEDDPVEDPGGAHAPVGPTGSDDARPGSPQTPEVGEPATALPRRTALSDAESRWGPRPHPPAVMAPPPPFPLAAPAVARMKRTTGTGLPPGLSSASAQGAGGVGSSSDVSAPTAVVPPTPPPASGETPVPARPNHPRVRRWFGRNYDAAPSDADEAPQAEDAGSRTLGSSGTDVGAAAGTDPAFAGAPEGMLAGVAPEADRGSSVFDPTGLEAAMERLSTGARRSALVALTVVATLLEGGERAEAVVQGRVPAPAGGDRAHRSTGADRQRSTVGP